MGTKIYETYLIDNVAQQRWFSEIFNGEGISKTKCMICLPPPPSRLFLPSMTQILFENKENEKTYGLITKSD